MANKNREFFGVFLGKNFLNVDFAQFHHLNESNRLIISTDWRKKMSSLSSWKFHYPTIIGRWENGEWKSEKFRIFCDKNLFFLGKYFDVPHAIGVLVRIFVEPITPELSQRGRLLGAVAQWQLRLCFFSQISWHVPTFQTCAANFSKPITYGHHVSAKSCAGSWATFLLKKNFEKNSASWFFFKKKFWKNAIFDYFSCLNPYFSETGSNTWSMVSCNLQAFHRLHFHSKLASKFFFRLRFLGKKMDEKKCRKIFSHL